MEAGGGVECRRAASLEVEEVAEVNAGGSVQVLGYRFLVIGSPEVDVFRRSGAKPQSELAVFADTDRLPGFILYANEEHALA
ncbi:MAG TPA: hypothetical protein VFY69_10840 [Solirubrobacterales bacterium]|nr:hypothetical protein [Solirubrobacterales bacterium]